jgi:hypothetical protein
LRQVVLDCFHAQHSSSRDGTLTFSNLEVRLLPASCGKVEFALDTGAFHLERAAKGEAKKDDGIFPWSGARGRKAGRLSSTTPIWNGVARNETRKSAYHRRYDPNVPRCKNALVHWSHYELPMLQDH